MSTITRNVTIIAIDIQTPDSALAAAARFQAVLDTVWITDDFPASARQIPGISGMYALSTKVTAPQHEVTVDAPIIARAIQSLAYPADSVTVN